jgi:hypothetical protein
VGFEYVRQIWKTVTEAILLKNIFYRASFSEFAPLEVQQF